MASSNQSPFYQKAESNFLNAKTDDERLQFLEEMIKECPKHKSAEKMLSSLKIRHKKLLEKMERQKKSGRSSGKPGIKKSDMQTAIVGLTNSGKSSLLSVLTNATPKISELPYTTTSPELGTFDYSNVKIQMIEVPAVDSPYIDTGLINTADNLIILINSIDDLEKIKPFLQKSTGKKIIAFNKVDLLNEEQKRKLESTLKSKKLDAILISTKTKQGIKELSDKIFQSFNKMRIYLKEPGKEASPIPLVMEKDSSIEEAIEKIKKGLSKEIKDVKLWGPSSKFGGQSVGLKHILKDLDKIEFRTK